MNNWPVADPDWVRFRLSHGRIYPQLRSRPLWPQIHSLSNYEWWPGHEFATPGPQSHRGNLSGSSDGHNLVVHYWIWLGRKVRNSFRLISSEWKNSEKKTQSMDRLWICLQIIFILRKQGISVPLLEFQCKPGKSDSYLGWICQKWEAILFVVQGHSWVNSNQESTSKWS